MSESFKGGQAATLFPIYKKIAEDQATSIFFSVFDLVVPFRDRLFHSVGKKSYKNGNDFDCILRPTIGGRLTAKDIPDALITLNQRNVWGALVEVKIGSAALDQAQLGRYLNRAISEKVDALITISNEMCMSPDQPPLRLKPAEKRLRKVAHYHWSWRYIECVAKECLKRDELNPIEVKILSQFGSLLELDSSIHGYRAMPSCWPNFVDTLRDGGRPSDENKEEVISGWFQEAADISLILSEIFNGDVEFIHTHKTLELRREAAEKTLEEDSDFLARFKVSNGKEIKVRVDVDKRVIQFETSHTPSDKVKTSHKQIEKFLDFFRDDENSGEWGDHSDVRIFAHWKRQKKFTDCSVPEAMIDLEEDTLKSSKIIMPDKELSSIKVRYTPTGAGGSFRSAKKVIEFLENHVKFFAETYVQK